ASEVCHRFPGLWMPKAMSAVFEQKAGCLAVESCVRSYAAEAQKLGAELRSGETVVGWKADTHGVTVETNRDTYQAARSVITPGAWASDLLANIGIRFEVRRKSLFWYDASSVYQ